MVWGTGSQMPEDAGPRPPGPRWATGGGPRPPWMRGARPPGGFRPPWWPENEPFAPSGRPRGRRRRHFARRLAAIVAALFVLLFVASALAVALLAGALGLGRHPVLAGLAGVIGLVLLFVTFVAAGRVFRRTAVPLSDVMEAADRLAAGDHAVRVEERGSREMRGLARSFNAMAERLRAGEEHRRNLLADVAHELRTPLSVIQGQTEGLLDGLYPPDRAHLEPLIEETRIMSRLLDDLQTLSTAEGGALRLHRQPCEPAQLVDDAVASFRSRAGADGVVLSARVPPHLTMVDVDPVRIGQVFSNLLSNALRHTPSGGSVVVSATALDGGAAVGFAVEDTGTGISPESLPHVFDRFVKAGDSKGAGLGLAIARSLVNAHGGDISAESAPGKGTTIRFTLPLR